MSGSPDIAVDADGLGKKYRIGQMQGGYTLLTEALGARLRHAGRKRQDVSEFWALRGIDFEVRHGERLGIIGHNGAGKSTLLKLLSRVTPPTEGTVRMRGRVGALLEVGTGFNQELTGRENIFLNGAILGMKRAEIARKFDEIVEFAEVERFIDTPVKRYSSGMYLRLAFAVAAHLEPEILIVDEVLSVGDLRFQEKCLGRMKQVAGEGRTVLFVSHNLPALTNLCPRSILLSGGRKVTEGPTDDVVREYVRGIRTHAAGVLADRPDRQGDGRLRFTDLRLESAGRTVDVARTGEDIDVVLEYEGRPDARLGSAAFAVTVYTMLGALVLQCQSDAVLGEFERIPARGEVRVRLPRCPLPGGQYLVNVFARVSGVVADWVQHAAELTVAEGDFYGSGRLPAESHTTVLVDQSWVVTPAEDARRQDAAFEQVPGRTRARS
jgi:lipopolysaccharide transport system ATP-binding protein